MYNRYIPQPDGSYRRDRRQESSPPPPPQQPRRNSQEQRHPQEPPCPPPVQQEPRRQERPRQPNSLKSMDAGDFLRQLLPKDLDTGDLMIILLLLLMAGDCAEDQNTALLTLVLYLFM